MKLTLGDGGVYALWHRGTGKFYVGSTTHFVQRRYQHVRNLGAGTHPCVVLQEDYNRNPVVKFIILAVTENLSEEEVYWIDTLDAQRTGYNQRIPRVLTGLSSEDAMAQLEQLQKGESL